MNSQILELKGKLEERLAQIKGADDLESVRVAFLGKNGEITGLLKKMGSLAAEERKSFGQAVNDRGFTSVGNGKFVNDAVKIATQDGGSIGGRVHRFGEQHNATASELYHQAGSAPGKAKKTIVKNGATENRQFFFLFIQISKEL